ncbi:MAG: cupin domain-containing protein [Sphaerochaetaceae bacterium]
MFISHRNKIEKIKQESPALKNVDKQVLIGPKEGWADYVMRLFTLGGDSYTPKHQHPWPHIIYIVQGEGILFTEETENKVTGGSVAFVDQDKSHQVRNTSSDKELIFICIVPKEGDV